MVNHVFPPIDCYLEGIPSFQTAEWLMIDELFHNVSQCFTMFHMFHGGSLIWMV